MDRRTDGRTLLQRCEDSSKKKIKHQQWEGKKKIKKRKNKRSKEEWVKKYCKKKNGFWFSAFLRRLTLFPRICQKMESLTYARTHTQANTHTRVSDNFLLPTSKPMRASKIYVCSTIPYFTISCHTLISGYIKGYSKKVYHDLDHIEKCGFLQII